MTLIVSPYYADSVVRMLEQSGHEVMVIGSVKAHADPTQRSVTVNFG
jgi:phosphoribosylaminoimidazole (AIR) synthetase